MTNLRTKPDKQKKPCGSFEKTVYEVLSRRDEVRNLSELVIKRIQNMGVETNLHQLELVLLEALTNALLYGNLEVSSKVRDTEGEDFFWQMVDEREKDSNFSSRKIVLQIDCIGDELGFAVRDGGDGFDWRNYLKSIDLGNAEKVHDRGILLIRNYVDELKWNDKGNEITFTIRVGPKSASRREQENGGYTQQD